MFVNRAMVQWMGSHGSALVGSSIGRLLARCGVDESRLRLEQLSAECPMTEHMVTHTRSDGSIETARWIHIASFDDSGTVTGYVSMCSPLHDSDEVIPPARETGTPDPSLAVILHRMKNSMALITSMIGLQQDGSLSPETNATLDALKGRIRTVALAHDLQHRARTLQELDLVEYAANVVRAARLAVSENAARVRLHAEPITVPLDIDRAIPTGLILFELTSASLRGRHSDDRAVTVTLAAGPDDSIILEVSDDGDGPEDAPGFRTPGGDPGLGLVEMLVRQLHGSFERLQPGMSCRVRFPVHRA